MFKKGRFFKKEIVKEDNLGQEQMYAYRFKLQRMNNTLLSKKEEFIALKYRSIVSKLGLWNESLLK